MDGMDDNLEFTQPPAEADPTDAQLKDNLEDPAGRSIGQGQEEMDQAESERLAERYFPEGDQQAQDDRIRYGMEQLGGRHADAAGTSIGHDDYQSGDVRQAGDGMDQEESAPDPVEADYELRKQMENFALPDGMGNASESADADPQEVRDLRTQFQENQQNLEQLQGRLQEVTNEGIDHYMDVRQEPQDDVAGAVDSWTKSHGTEREMFTEEQTQEIDDLRHQIDELQQQQDELRSQIQSARQENHGFPRS